MGGKTMFSVVALILVLFVGAQSVYIIPEIQKAVMLRLGRVEVPDLAVGLHFKWPFIDQVERFDGRILTLDARAERFLTVEKKSMIVDSFAKWRIIDVSKYYTATSGDQARAERLLAQRINEGLRNEFATRSLQEVVSGERDQIMSDLIVELNGFAKESMGILVVDVRVKKIDLPDEVSEPVFNRMRAEREREAREHRAIGKELAAVIEAEAERESTVIEAEAYREAEKIRGAGDAQATAIYADAYGKDPEFYAFVRSLNAYKSTFAGKEDLILVDPSSDFFSYFGDAQGGRGK